MVAFPNIFSRYVVFNLCKTKARCRDHLFASLADQKILEVDLINRIEKNDIDFIQTLLKKEKLQDSIFYAKIAAIQGHFDLSMRLLPDEPEIDALRFLMIWAVIHQESSQVSSLMAMLPKEARAQNFQQSGLGYFNSLVSCAVCTQNKEIVNVLVENEVDVSGVMNDPVSLLWTLVTHREQFPNFEFFNFLLENDFGQQQVNFEDPNLVSQFRTLYFFAAEQGNLQFFKFLFELAAGSRALTPLKLTDEAGKDALMLAAENGHPALVKWLLDLKDVYLPHSYIDNEGDRRVEGYSALAFAAKNNHHRCVKLLIKAGAWPWGNLKGNPPISPLAVAPQGSRSAQLIQNAIEYRELKYSARELKNDNDIDIEIKGITYDVDENPLTYAQVERLFADYANSSWCSFFRHPLRHHRALVSAALKKSLEERGDEDDKLAIQKLVNDISTRLASGDTAKFNRFGSLAKRLALVIQKTKTAYPEDYCGLQPMR